jgi:hypothetical protein
MWLKQNNMAPVMQTKMGQSMKHLSPAQSPITLTRKHLAAALPPGPSVPPVVIEPEPGLLSFAFVRPAP